MVYFLGIPLPENDECFFFTNYESSLRLSFIIHMQFCKRCNCSSRNYYCIAYPEFHNNSFPGEKRVCSISFYMKYSRLTINSKDVAVYVLQIHK